MGTFSYIRGCGGNGVHVAPLPPPMLHGLQRHVAWGCSVMLHDIRGLGCLVEVTISHLEQGAIEQQAVSVSVVSAIGTPLALNLDVAKAGKLPETALCRL